MSSPCGLLQEKISLLDYYTFYPRSMHEKCIEQHCGRLNCSVSVFIHDCVKIAVKSNLRPLRGQKVYFVKAHICQNVTLTCYPPLVGGFSFLRNPCAFISLFVATIVN
jgi:hypothetical protein